MPSTLQYSFIECSSLQMVFLYEKRKKNTFHSSSRCTVVAFSSSYLAQVSSRSKGFTYWLTVSITIIGMIGSFKSVSKRLVSYISYFFHYYTPSNSYCSVECGNVLYWTFPPSWLLLFLDLWLKSPCSILSDLYIWMKIYAWELNVPVLSNQTRLFSGSWDYIKV